MKNSLASKALLVNLTISQWSGRKQDAEATRSVSQSFSTNGSTGAYHKKLLPDSSQFEKVTSLASQIRKYFHEQTLPWLGDGTRIISSMNYIEFTNGLGKLKTEFDHAVNDFVSAYPSLSSLAASSLGALYKPSEYPTQDEMRLKFGIKTVYLPMPDASDFRTQVTESERAEFEKMLSDVEASAKRDCIERLSEVVKKAKQKLSDPNAIFRDSLVENITDLCDLLPRLNITEDAEIAKTIEDLKALDLDAGSLRKNASERKEQSDSLAKIESRMNIFLKAGI